MKGRRVEVLFTPSLYGIAARRGIVMEVQDRENFSEVLDVYVKIIYLAALNAWEVRRFDNPELDEFDLSLMDFVLWSSEKTKDFGKMIKAAVECLTGKPLIEGDEPTGEDVKKK